MGVTLAENEVNTKIDIIIDYKPTITILFLRILLHLDCNMA